MADPATPREKSEAELAYEAEAAKVTLDEQYAYAENHNMWHDCIKHRPVDSDVERYFIEHVLKMGKTAVDERTGGMKSITVVWKRKNFDILGMMNRRTAGVTQVGEDPGYRAQQRAVENLFTKRASKGLQQSSQATGGQVGSWRRSRLAHGTGRKSTARTSTWTRKRCKTHSAVSSCTPASAKPSRWRRRALREAAPARRVIPELIDNRSCCSRTTSILFLLNRRCSPSPSRRRGSRRCEPDSDSAYSWLWEIMLPALPEQQDGVSRTLTSPKIIKMSHAGPHVGEDDRKARTAGPPRRDRMRGRDGKWRDNFFDGNSPSKTATRALLPPTCEITGGRRDRATRSAGYAWAIC